MSHLENKECITADEIIQALNLIPDEIKTEKNVKWIKPIFGYDQLCQDINDFDARISVIRRGELQTQYYKKLLGPLSESEFKDLLEMVYNKSVTLEKMYLKYKDKIYENLKSYSFFGLTCFIIKTIKSYRNEHNVRYVLNEGYPSIFLSPEEVKARLEEIKRRQLLEVERQRALGQQPLEQHLSYLEKDFQRQEADRRHALMISGIRQVNPYDGDIMGQSRSPDQFHTALFDPSPTLGAQGGSRRIRRRTAHRKRKSHRNSKRVHHTRRKYTRRHRHRR